MVTQRAVVGISLSSVMAVLGFYWMFFRKKKRNIITDSSKAEKFIQSVESSDSGLGDTTSSDKSSAPSASDLNFNSSDFFQKETSEVLLQESQDVSAAFSNTVLANKPLSEAMAVQPIISSSKQTEESTSFVSNSSNANCESEVLEMPPPASHSDCSQATSVDSESEAQPSDSTEVYEEESLSSWEHQTTERTFQTSIPYKAESTPQSINTEDRAYCSEQLDCDDYVAHRLHKENSTLQSISTEENADGVQQLDCDNYVTPVLCRAESTLQTVSTEEAVDTAEQLDCDNYVAHRPYKDQSTLQSINTEEDTDGVQQLDGDDCLTPIPYKEKSTLQSINTEAADSVQQPCCDDFVNDDAPLDWSEPTSYIFEKEDISIKSCKEKLIEANGYENGIADQEDESVRVYEFEFPSELCGRLIGSRGRNINQLKDRSGTDIMIKPHPCTPDLQLVSIHGTQSRIDSALRIVRSRFPRSHYAHVDLRPAQGVLNGPAVVVPAPTLPFVGMPPVITPVMPPPLLLSLPAGVPCEVMISSIVSAQRVFVQQPSHPAFNDLNMLSQCMLTCYGGQQPVPHLPQPITVGTICAAPMMGGWYRAQIVDYQLYNDVCDVKYVDFGGYASIPACELRQIRTDFMTMPFQAIEVLLSHIEPLEGEDDFNSEACAVMEELTRGNVLQLFVVGQLGDMPLVDLYTQSDARVDSEIVPEQQVYINYELLMRGVVRWQELRNEESLEEQQELARAQNGYPQEEQELLPEQ